MGLDENRSDIAAGPLSDKLKALLDIAAAVQHTGKDVTDELVSVACAAGATDLELRDTVLIAAAFCMYNRYVDGLATVAPDDPENYAVRAKALVESGYIPVVDAALAHQAARRWIIDGKALAPPSKVTFMSPSVLYCRDPLNPRRVDEHFAAEAQQVRARGGGVATIDHDALLGGDARQAVARVPAEFGPVWYRGWMIPSERYCALAGALGERGVTLVVAPDRYRAAHELPGWYQEFEELTPASVWSELEVDQYPDDKELALLAGRLQPGPGIVKDYVKSRKYEWDEACFIPDLSDAAALGRVARRFVELQGEFLAGGIVLREFESFVKPQSAAGEVRVWWLDGEARMLMPHPDNDYGLGLVPGLGEVASAVRRLGSRFVTTDLALRSDGVWRVVEVGDGQVSDLHASVDPGELAEILLAG